MLAFDTPAAAVTCPTVGISPSASRPRAPVRMRSRAPRAIGNDTRRDRLSRQVLSVNDLGSSHGPVELGWRYVSGPPHGDPRCPRALPLPRPLPPPPAQL